MDEFIKELQALMMKHGIKEIEANNREEIIFHPKDSTQKVTKFMIICPDMLA